LNHFNGFVSGAVIDDGKPKPLFNRFGERGNNLWDIVGRGDEVDVVATYLLESKHETSHVRGGNAFTLPEMADVIILAENAPKVAVGKEDCP
jgi:hypothetical protein